ncbi:MAG: hypothetical protein AB1491_01960 [Thermodesulfobacteriota bacterium]
MGRFFNFYDPLERRYIFNNFLVIVALVEFLILVFTLLWQVDEGIFTGQVKVVPFPWQEYLLVSFAAPLALLFIFGLIVRGFQALAPEERQSSGEPGPGPKRTWKSRNGVFLLLAALLAVLALVIFGERIFFLTSWPFKALGLGGTYLLVALVALACLYFPLRLLLNYRLKKKALEYQYLLHLAERHGLVGFEGVNPDSLPDSLRVRLLGQPEDATRAQAADNLKEDSPG